jgi:hypothetical protein
VWVQETRLTCLALPCLIENGVAVGRRFEEQTFIERLCAPETLRSLQMKPFHNALGIHDTADQKYRHGEW